MRPDLTRDVDSGTSDPNDGDTLPEKRRWLPIHMTMQPLALECLLPGKVRRLWDGNMPGARKHSIIHAFTRLSTLRISHHPFPILRLLAKLHFRFKLHMLLKLKVCRVFLYVLQQQAVAEVLRVARRIEREVGEARGVARGVEDNPVIDGGPDFPCLRVRSLVCPLSADVWLRFEDISGKAFREALFEGDKAGYS